RFYYEMIQKRYTGTKYATRAAKLLEELQGEVAPPRRAEKPRVRVGQIHIVGNTRVSDTKILEALELYPGQILDPSEVRFAEQRLRKLKLPDASWLHKMSATVETMEQNGDSPYRDIFVRVIEELRQDVLAEVDKMEGTWVVTSASVDGKDVPHLRDGEMVFRGNGMTSHLNKNSPGGRSTFTL